MENNTIKILISLMFINLVYAQLEITEIQALQIAQNTFQQEVPKEIRNEYVLSHIERNRIIPEYYEIWWARKINGIPVIGDRFYIYIDSRNRNIVEKHLDYSTPFSQIDTSYVITKDQARWLVENAYKGKLIEGPNLFIVNKKTVWRVWVGFSGTHDTVWINIDAKTGETISFELSEGASIENFPTAKINFEIINRTLITDKPCELVKNLTSVQTASGELYISWCQHDSNSLIYKINMIYINDIIFIYDNTPQAEGIGNHFVLIKTQKLPIENYTIEIYEGDRKVYTLNTEILTDSSVDDQFSYLLFGIISILIISIYIKVYLFKPKRK